MVDHGLVKSVEASRLVQHTSVCFIEVLRATLWIVWRVVPVFSVFGFMITAVNACVAVRDADFSILVLNSHLLPVILNLCLVPFPWLEFPSPSKLYNAPFAYNRLANAPLVDLRQPFCNPLLF